MDELQQNALRDDWMYGRCERTGLCGGFPYDSIYILPTCQKPPPDFMVLLALYSTLSLSLSLSLTPFLGLVGTGVLNRRCRPSSRSEYALYGHSAVTIVVGTWVENAH